MCGIELRLLVLQSVLQQDVWSKDLLTFLLFLVCKHSTAAASASDRPVKIARIALLSGQSPADLRIAS